MPDRKYLWDRVDLIHRFMAFAALPAYGVSAADGLDDPVANWFILAMCVIYCWIAIPTVINTVRLGWSRDENVAAYRALLHATADKDDQEHLHAGSVRITCYRSRRRSVTVYFEDDVVMPTETTLGSMTMREYRLLLGHSVVYQTADTLPLARAGDCVVVVRPEPTWANLKDIIRSRLLARRLGLHRPDPSDVTQVVAWLHTAKPACHG